MFLPTRKPRNATSKPTRPRPHDSHRLRNAKTPNHTSPAIENGHCHGAKPSPTNAARGGERPPSGGAEGEVGQLDSPGGEEFGGLRERERHERRDERVVHHGGGGGGGGGHLRLRGAGAFAFSSKSESARGRGRGEGVPTPREEATRAARRGVERRRGFFWGLLIFFFLFGTVRSLFASSFPRFFFACSFSFFSSSFLASKFS